MKISIILDARTINKEGKHPIKFRFTQDNKSVYVATGMFAFEDEFSTKTFFSGKDKHHRRMNDMLSSELDRAEQLLFDLEKKGSNVGPAKLKELFTNKKPSFNQYFESFIATKTGRTRELYQATLNKINEFAGTVNFEDVGFAFLQSFDRYMQQDTEEKKALKTNARGIHFRNIRAVYNQAINEDLVSLSLYPFRKFRIKKETTQKRSISIEVLRKLFNYEGNELENRSRDVAKLIFFLIGINVKDLVFLTKIENGRIEYRRFKTATPISIKVEPEALQLIEKYKGDDYLLKFAGCHSDYRTFNAKINLHLSEIAKKIKISKITTYTLRHTWATLAAELEVPKETISAALGHGAKTVTDVYIKFDRKKIDEANRKVIDYVLFNSL
jgi:integrase